LAGLGDRQRSGRPRGFAAEVVAEVKAMACEPPSARAVPLARWIRRSWPRRAVTEGLTVSVSAATVRRWLADDAIKPWQHRSWIFPRDPDFAVKAARVLDLYQRIWDGAALGADEYAISADEKSQLQALSRCHPEVVFSVIQRKVVKPADFTDLDALAQRLTAFEPRYNAAAKPFDWTFHPRRPRRPALANRRPPRRADIPAVTT